MRTTLVTGLLVTMALAGCAGGYTSTVQVKVGGGFSSVAYEQRIDIWLSFAYNGELPDGYSAFPPSGTEPSGESDLTLPLRV